MLMGLDDVASFESHSILRAVTFPDMRAEILLQGEEKYLDDPTHEFIRITSNDFFSNTEELFQFVRTLEFSQGHIMSLLTGQLSSVLYTTAARLPSGEVWFGPLYAVASQK